MDVLSEIQNIVGSAPVAVVVVALLIIGLAKKLVKLAATAGVLLAAWLVISQLNLIT